MQIYGLMMVRNEADIVGITIRHHLAQGIDHFLVVDNGSTDGTDRVLEELSRDQRVRWVRSTGEFRQADITTELAREAYLRGADWVLPIDADEFWWAPEGDFRAVLETSTSGALQVEVVNFVQRRDQTEASPSALLHMTRRVPAPVGPPDDRVVDMVERRQIGYIEFQYPQKWISRASIAVEIHQGNHSVAGIVGPPGVTSRIVCLHAPMRARSVLGAKVDHGRRAEEVAQYLVQAWHVRRWRRLAEEGRLEEEWAANSYCDDALDVNGERHPVVFDPRLRDVVTPWVQRRLAPVIVQNAVSAPPLRLRSHEDHSPAEHPCSPQSLSLGVESHPDNAARAAVWARIREIEGWMRDGEVDLLIDLAWKVFSGGDEGAVVEVGSYHGKSTVLIGTVAKMLASRMPVYAIDPHEGEVGALDSPVGMRIAPSSLSNFLRNLRDADLLQTVELIQSRSFEVRWSKPIALLFIDGLHDYLNVSRDFRHFDPWVTVGGYVAFHDCEEGFPGVKSFVEEVIVSGRYRKVDQSESLAVLQKCAIGRPSSNPSASLQSAQISDLSLSRPHGEAQIIDLGGRARVSEQRLGPTGGPLEVTHEPHAQERETELSDGSQGNAELMGRIGQLVGSNTTVLALEPSDELLRILHDRGCRIVAMVFGEEPSHYLRETSAEVLSRQLDGENTGSDLGGHRFDVIVSIDALGFFRDPSPLLRETRRALQPDGCLIVTLPNVAHASNRIALLHGLFPRSDGKRNDPRQVRFYTQASMVRLLEEAGFAIGRLERDEVPIDASQLATLPAQISETLSNDPDALTYRFVVVAYPLARPELKVLQERMRDLAERYEAAQRELQNLASLEVRVAQQDKGIEFLQKEMSRRQQLANEAQEHLTNLQGALAEKEARIASQDQELGLLRAEVATLSAEGGAYRQSKLVRVVRWYWSIRQRLF